MGFNFPLFRYARTLTRIIKIYLLSVNMKYALCTNINELYQPVYITFEIVCAEVREVRAETIEHQFPDIVPTSSAAVQPSLAEY